MAAIIEEAGEEAQEILDNSVIQPWHSSLKKAKVDIRVFFASPGLDQNGDPKPGPALKHHGIACLGLAKLINYENRVKGRADGEITVDKVWWDAAHNQERIALLDHEATHFELVRDKETGEVKKDDLGRPKLRMRKHDYDMPGVFMEVVRRHKDAAAETRAFTKFQQCEDGQLLFSFSKVG